MYVKEGDFVKRRRKIVSLLIAAAMVTPLALSNVNTVEAANKFAGQESKYYRLCSSKTLTRSNQNTCKEFNKYLKTKSASLATNDFCNVSASLFCAFNAV